MRRSRPSRSRTPFSTFYGESGWTNFINWIVTLCVGGILVHSLTMLGGVRPEAQSAILPLFVILLGLHGLSYLLGDIRAKYINPAPLLFVPFLIFNLISVQWLTPVPWLGSYQLIAVLQAFVLLWVICHHIHMWSQMWVLILMCFVPMALGVYNGFFQFFQQPDKIVDGLSEVEIILADGYLGKATGTFADPGSFAGLLLISIIVLLIVAFNARLSPLVRIFSIYLSALLYICMLATQQTWAIASMLPLSFLVGWVTVRKPRGRLKRGLVLALIALILPFAASSLHPRIEASYQSALDVEAEMLRFSLIDETVAVIKDHPLLGFGAGSFQLAYDQYTDAALKLAPESPQSDLVTLLIESGLTGTALFILPFFFVLYAGFSRWRSEPFKVKSDDVADSFMPKAKLTLGVTFCALCMFALISLLNSVFLVPGLLFWAVVTFGLFSKVSLIQRLRLPGQPVILILCFMMCIVSAISVYTYSNARLKSHAISMNAGGQLDHIVSKRIHVSGDGILLNAVIDQYREALKLDSQNVDALIGLSVAQCQIYFSDPSIRVDLGTLGAQYASEAIERSDGKYWKAWAQLGISQALSGEIQAAEVSLRRALELAPNNSDALYYWASLNVGLAGKEAVAIDAVNRALEINPEHIPARRLQRKLRIL